MIGGPNTGKSHFTFQLFGRLSEKTCALKLREMSNLELFKEGLERLSRGLSAEHTSSEKYDNADLAIVSPDGQPFDLLWPDYGGEQIRQILEKRGLDDHWKQRLEGAERFFFSFALMKWWTTKTLLSIHLLLNLTTGRIQRITRNQIYHLKWA